MNKLTKIIISIISVAVMLSMVVGAAASFQFNDVEPDDYYYDAVSWAVENRVTLGTSVDTFSPDDPCTRAQMVTFLARYDKVVDNKFDNLLDYFKTELTAQVEEEVEDEFEQKLDKALSVVDKKIDALTDRVTDLENKVSDLEKTLTQQEKDYQDKITALEKEIKTLKEADNETETVMAGIVKKKFDVTLTTCKFTVELADKTELTFFYKKHSSYVSAICEGQPVVIHKFTTNSGSFYSMDQAIFVVENNKKG